jgi:mannose-6-phosphate isomerase-like protein (cupin superfamily)
LIDPRLIRAKIAFVLAASFAIAGCALPAKRISPEQTWPSLSWSEEEKTRDVAVRPLWRTQEASGHAVRLRTAEKPHVHDHHDLVVFVMKGEARLHFADRSVDVKAGDVIEIPRGTLHWAENTGRGPGEAYALYTPAFDGQDIRPVDVSEAPQA